MAATTHSLNGWYYVRLEPDDAPELELRLQQARETVGLPGIELVLVPQSNDDGTDLLRTVSQVRTSGRNTWCVLIDNQELTLELIRPEGRFVLKAD